MECYIPWNASQGFFVRAKKNLKFHYAKFHFCVKIFYTNFTKSRKIYDFRDFWGFWCSNWAPKPPQIAGVDGAENPVFSLNLQKVIHAKAIFRGFLGVFTPKKPRKMAFACITFFRSVWKRGPKKHAIFEYPENRHFWQFLTGWGTKDWAQPGRSLRERVLAVNAGTAIGILNFLGCLKSRSGATTNAKIFYPSPRRLNFSGPW